MPEPDKTVIIVDDDHDFLEMNRRVLVQNGYRVLCCTNYEDALRCIKKHRPSLVVTDLMMDSMDSGFVLSRRIKQDPELQGIAVIIVTAASSRHGFDFKPQTPEELAGMNADAYFDKPLSCPVFLKKVSELTRGRKKG